MIDKKIIIAITLSLSVTWASAQSKLFLKPHLGGQVPYAHYDRSIGIDNNSFKPRYFDITDNFGLMLQLKLNEDWSLATGWSKGNIGWGFRIEIPDHLVKNPYQSPRHSHGTGNYIHRFPIQAFRNLKNITFLPINQAQDLYVFAFKLHTLIGVSVDYIDQKSPFDDNESTSVYPFDDKITYKEISTILNRWGASAMAGVAMQYYHNGKERFELNLYYS